MSWEALRLTSRSPGEVYAVLGPHGVEELIRDMRNVCWRECPPEQRTLANVQKIVREVFDRNMAVWSAIKKPSPEAFFRNLLPHAADGHMRQALVLCWMMLPRGKKSIQIVRQLVTEISDRTMAAWEQDNQTFTKGPRKVKAKGKAKRGKAKPVKKRKKK